MERRQPSILTTNRGHFWWMTFLAAAGRMRASFWAVARRLHSDSFVFARLAYKNALRDSYLEALAELRADLAPTQLIGAPAPLDECCVGCCCFFRPPLSSFFFSFVFARLNDGADKKRDDIDGEGSAQSRRREEALRRAWKFGAGGPGELAAQRTAEPENNFGFPAWKPRRHPDQRQIWNWQPLRLAPQQREQPVGGDFLDREQEENEPLLRSFPRFGHQQWCGGGMPYASLPKSAQGKQQR